MTRSPRALDNAVELPAALEVALVLAIELLIELLLLLEELLLDEGGGVELEELVGGVHTEDDDEERLVVGGVQVEDGFSLVGGGVHLEVELVAGGVHLGVVEVVCCWLLPPLLLLFPPLLPEPHDQLVYASPHAAPPVTALHAPGVRSRDPQGHPGHWSLTVTVTLRPW